jgi:hypothetical protein
VFLLVIYINDLPPTINTLSIPIILIFADDTIARMVLEDICDKPIQIHSYCAVARLHGV